MLALESSEWSTQFPIWIEASCTVLLLFSEIGWGSRSSKFTGQTVSDPGQSFPWFNVNS
jgi:hypothetical protein